MKTVLTIAVLPDGTKNIVATSEVQGRLMSHVSQTFPESIPGFPQEVLDALRAQDARGGMNPGYRFAMTYTTPEDLGEVVTLEKSTLREVTHTHLWAGASFMVCGESLFQDLMGQARYLQLVHTAWVPWWISVPAVLSLIVFTSYTLSRASEKLTPKVKNDNKVTITTQDDDETPSEKGGTNDN